VNDPEINELLAKAALDPPKVDPALLERVADSIAPSLKPVRPLPPKWVLTGGLVLICASVAGAGAARAGFGGVEALTPLERVLIFATLATLVLAASQKLVGEAIPGSPQRLTPSALVSVSCALLIGVFLLLFRDYRTEHFVSAGLVCLATGVLHAIPIGLLGWLLLRRAYAVNPVAAGLVGGILAGLGGVTMLELHCTNFQALHVLIWHTAVVPVSGLAGALAGWAVSRRRARAPR